jgi:hypothetical protein
MPEKNNENKKVPEHPLNLRCHNYNRTGKINRYLLAKDERVAGLLRDFSLESMIFICP